ncbi:MAG: polyphenol oxidase family protein [Clostridia bacterium]|nr:polyphenol oxidase family protein [Clostridia bacterium]
MVLNSELGQVKKENVEYLYYKKLYELGVINAFSLKGLNFRNREDLHIDYKVLLNALKIEYKCLLKPLAKHTDNILVINKKINENTADINMDYLDGVDGVITNKKNIALATTSADCLCVILYDPIKKVIANVHSGWRGSFQKICKKTILKMKQEFHCCPQDILAFLMPAIRQCHFEVDDDVMLECKKIFEYTGRLDEIIKIGRKIDNVQKYNIDNILINKILLEEEGVLGKNIYDSDLCSVCNSNKMHSRRADGENFGISTTIAMMV